MSLLPLLDSFTLTRSVSGADADGNANTTVDVIGTYRGTYGSAAASDRDLASRRGEQIDAFIAVPFAVDVRPGDRLAGLRGHRWVAVSVNDVRLHNRVALRRVA